MKKTLLCFASVLAVQLAQAQVPNLNFETWSGGDPEDWSTPNGFNPGNVEQETILPGGGLSSAKLNVKTCLICPSFGYPDPLPGFVFQQVEYHARPATFTFKMRGNVATGDTALVGIQLTGGGAVIGDAMTLFPPSGMPAWQTMNVTVAYSSSAIPDSIYIGALTDVWILTTGTGTSSTSTVLYVDDLVMSGGTTGIELLESTNTLIVAYPNPASNLVNFNLLGTDASMLEVIDITGKTVYTESNILSKHILNVEGFENGAYIVRFYNNSHALIGSTRFNVVK